MVVHGAAVLDVADPRRAHAGDQHATRAAGEVAYIADLTVQVATVFHDQSAGALLADIDITDVGPGRAGAGDDDGAVAANAIAEEADGVGNRAAAGDSQCAGSRLSDIQPGSDIPIPQRWRGGAGTAGEMSPVPITDCACAGLKPAANTVISRATDGSRGEGSMPRSPFVLSLLTRFRLDSHLDIPTSIDG